MDSDKNTNNPVGSNEKWLSMSEASSFTPYSAEYLSLLARKKKLTSKKIGNTWYTTKGFLDDYMKRQMIRTHVQNGNLNNISEIARSVPTAENNYQASAGSQQQKAKLEKIKKEELKKYNSLKKVRSYQEDMQEYAKLVGVSVPDLHKAPVEHKKTSLSASLGKILSRDELNPVIFAPASNATMKTSLKRLKKAERAEKKAKKEPAKQQVVTGQVGSESSDKNDHPSKLAPVVSDIEQALERVIDRRGNPTFVQRTGMLGNAKKFGSQILVEQNSPVRIVAASRTLTVAVLVVFVLMTLLPTPLVFSFFDKSLGFVTEAVSDANTVMGFRPGTHKNEILLLDKEGNISIMGHIETEGQLRSYAPDGVAPIVVDSTSMVKNLNAQYVGGLEAKDFTLSFVTKNGNVTTQDVKLSGNVEVGKTLLVKGATKLLSALEVGGELTVFGDVTLNKMLSVEGPTHLKDNLSVGKNVSIRGSLDVGSSIIGHGASFSSVSIDGSLSADGEITLGDPDEFFTIDSKNITLKENGDAVLDGSFEAASISARTSSTTALTSILADIASIVAEDVSVDALTAENSTTTNATTTNLFSTSADISSLTFSSATGTNATTTNFFSDTASSTNLFSANANFGSLSVGSAFSATGGLSTFSNLLLTGSSTLQNFTFTDATGTAATTTNLFSNKGTFDELYVNDYEQNDGTFTINSNVPTGDIFSVLDSLITSGTLIHQSLTANAGNGQVSEGQVIDLIDNTEAGGGYSALAVNVTGNGAGSGSKYLLDLNPGNGKRIVFDAAGSLRPTTAADSNTNSIGSPEFYWNNGYFDTITANSLSGDIITGATSNDTWTIGSDELNDTTKSLIFQRNSGSGNATLSWNASSGVQNDQRFLSVNYPFNATYTIDDDSISTTSDLYSGLLTNNTTAGTQSLMSLVNTGTGITENGIYIGNTGTGITGLEIAGTWTNGIITNNNSVNLGSGGLLFGSATGTSATTTSLFSTTARFTNLIADAIDFTDLLFDNATGTNATTTNFFATTASSTNLFSSLLNVGGDALVVDEDGNVGIGVASPDTIFDLAYSDSTLYDPDDSSTFSTPVEIKNSAAPLASGANNLIELQSRWSGAWQSVYFGAVSPSYKNTDFIVATTDDGTSTEKFRITSDGNVGIGTSEPANKLEVWHSDSGNVFTSALTQNGLSIVNSDTTNNNWSTIIFGDNNVAPSAAIGVQHTDHANNYGEIAFGTRGANGYAERLRIDSIGRVGIGTTNPNSLLHVNSSAGDQTLARFVGGANSGITLANTASSGTIAQTFQTGGNNRWRIAVDADDSNKFKFQSGGTFETDVLTLDQDGNVGIGTTTPSEKLSVVGNISIGNNSESVDRFLDIRRAGVVNDALLRFNVGGVNTWALGYTGDSTNSFHIRNQRLDTDNITITDASGGQQIIFTTNDTERMRIDGTTGNVGIGTNDPDSPLHISGTTGLLRLEGPSSESQSWIDFRNGDGLQMGSINMAGTSSALRISTANSKNLYLAGATTGNRLQGDWINEGALEQRGDITNSQGSVDIDDDLNVSDVLFVDNTNERVGIGTTTPAYTLDVDGNIRATGSLVEKKVTFTPTTVGWYRIVSGSSFSGGVIRISGSYDNKNTDVEFQYNIAGYGQNNNIQETRFGSYNDGVVSKARVSNNGNSGVYLDIYVSSATSPGEITVYGYGPEQDDFVENPVVGAVAGSDDVSELVLGPGFRTTDGIHSDGTSTDSYILSSLGVGTTNPGNGVMLEVSNTGDSILEIAGDSDNSGGDDGTQNSTLRLSSDGGAGWWDLTNYNNNGSARLSFNDGDEDFFSILSNTGSTNGFVGIGTIAPTEMLEVAGNIKVANDSNIYGLNQIVGFNDLRFYADNVGTTELMRLSSTGGLSLGNAYVDTDAGAGNMIMTGKLAVGTSTLPAKFTVNGNFKLGYAYGDVDTTQVIGAATNDLYLFSNDYLMGRGDYSVVFSIPDDTGGFYISRQASANLLNPSSGAAFVVAGNTGYVGIGTTTPWGKLAVVNTGADPSFIVEDSASDTSPFIIDASGNVGIGTTTPGTTLDVAGNINVGKTGSGGKVSFARDADGTYQATLGWFSNNQFRQYFAGGSSSYSISSYNSGLVDLLTVLTGGNVGIGTTTPSALLTVNDPAGVDPFLIGSSTPKFIVTESGNIGIGVADPDEDLVIGGSDGGSLVVEASDGSNWFQVGGSAGQGTVLLSPAGGMTQVSGSGNLGARMNIGPLTPTTVALAIAGVAEQTANLLEINSKGDLSGDLFVVDADGNVGISTTTPATKLTIAGTTGDAILSFNDTGSFMNKRGIQFYTDTNWGIYAGRGGRAGNSLDGDTSATGAGFALDALYLRVPDSSNNGFIFENSNEELLASIRGNDGMAYFAGNVGIGTTTPWGSLSITNTGTGPSFVVEDSTSPDTTPFIIDASGNVGIGRLPAAANNLAVDGSVSIDNYISISNNLTTSGAIGPGSLLTSGTGNNDLTLKGQNNLFLSGGGSTSAHVTINSSGNVGIGTTTPTSLLSVYNPDVSAGGTVFKVFGNTNSSTKYLMDVEGQDGSVLSILGSGAVGIGTTVPGVNSPFGSGMITEIATNDSGTYSDTGTGRLPPSLQLGIRNSASGSNIMSGIAFAGQGSGGANKGAYIGMLPGGAYGTEALVFGHTTGSDSYAESMRIDGNNVGIGYTAPQTLLDIRGLNQSIPFNAGPNGSAMVNLLSESCDIDTGASILFSSYYDGDNIFGGSSIGAMKEVGCTSSTSYAETALVFRTSSYPDLNTERMRIDANGLVGIGVTDPSVALDVSGSIEYTGSITDVSDARLKENINELEPALGKLMQIAPVSFNMIGDTNVQLGFTAQDVQEFFPEAVSVIDSEGHLGLDYTQLISPAVRAIQELNEKVDNLSTTRLNLVVSTTTASELSNSLFTQASDALREGIYALNDTIVRVYDTAIYASSGIFGKIFAREVNTDKLCVGSVCVNSDEFLEMVLNSTGSVTLAQTATSTNDNQQTTNNSQQSTTNTATTTSSTTSSTTPDFDLDTDTSATTGDSQASSTVATTTQTTDSQQQTTNNQTSTDTATTTASTDEDVTTPANTTNTEVKDDNPDDKNTSTIVETETQETKDSTASSTPQ